LWRIKGHTNSLGRTRGKQKRKENIGGSNIGEAQSKTKGRNVYTSKESASKVEIFMKYL